ncbi:Mov34/MPN/PAD-1 family protein [Candidatus Micrarchaeota archaeon]|nr:Mov34/MPN/PAD-1 family protein [Candidatus Micrarchaeota archaeon]
MRIKKRALLSALESAKSVYPNEFVGLFREEDGILRELIIAPFSEYGAGFSSFSDFHLPLDPSITGTFHSHPSSSNHPSKGDLEFFSRKGRVHFIAGAPYGIEDVKAFNQKGEEIQFELVD